MDIRECIEVLKACSPVSIESQPQTVEDFSNALDLATQTLQDVADGKLIKPMKRIDLKLALSPMYEKWVCDDPDCTQHDLEEVLNDIADALQGKV